MKIFMLLLLISNMSFAHKDKVIKHNYGNVSVTTFASDYVEEMNKTLIIAQYAEMIAKELKYYDKIYLLFSEEQLSLPSVKSWMPEADGSPETDGIHIMFRFKSFNIAGCLNVIHSSLNSRGLKNEKNITIYNGKVSSIVTKILSTKIYRPNEIKELEKHSLYSYYIEGGKYHLIRNEEDKEEELSILDNILDYQILSRSIVIAFTNFDEYKIFQSKVPVRTEHINNIPNFYWPYNVHLSGDNKIIFEFYWRSESKNRVMLYFLDKNIFIQDLDKALDR